jgi:hypothetical protein
MEATDGEIDALLYELYGLTQEQRAVAGWLDHSLATPSVGAQRLVSGKLWDDNVLGSDSAHLWGERADPVY